MTNEVRYRLSGPGKLDFSWSPVGGPIEEHTPATAVLFEKIGRCTASWARMEFLLDSILLHVNKEEASAELYDRDHSRGFQTSINLLKRWLDHPALVAEKDSIESFLDVVRKLADYRNDMIHGHLKAFDANKGEFTTQRLKFLGDNNFRVAEGSRPLESLDVFYDLCEKAKLALMDIAGKVFGRARSQGE